MSLPISSPSPKKKEVEKDRLLYYNTVIQKEEASYVEWYKQA